MRRGVLCAMCVVLFSAVGSAAFADGFRPDSGLEDAFLDDIGAARITVFPTILRDPYMSRYSPASRDRVVSFLSGNNLASATSADTRLSLGKPEARSQFEMFQAALAGIGSKIADMDLETDYAMVLEVMFPPSSNDRLQVFGIHVYLLTPEGENAFSFLLNSHHESFSRARLRARRGTAEEKEALAMKATPIALAALKQQIANARECMQREKSRAIPEKRTGTIDSLDAGASGDSVPPGFSTFNGQGSTAAISVTTVHPARPMESDGNRVLQMDVNVRDWAGTMHTFGDVAPENWGRQDWSDGKELSFWFYGHNDGTRLFVDVLDNRRRCSMADDAERYTYEFVDGFDGWQLVSIPFEVMRRKEIYNGAPNDGLGLTAVHGWGIGTLWTGEDKTYFIDDVTVRSTPIYEDVPEGLSLEEHVWSPINELPMYGSYEKTDHQRAADEQFIRMALPDFDGDHAAAAEHFARSGWNAYYEDDWSTAIKRFNQAWLLHAENQHALWGFATISRERGKLDAALHYYEMAVDAGAEITKLNEEYRRLQAQVAR